MAFDAGFTAAIINELKCSLMGARVEKVFQPTRDSVLLMLRADRGDGHSITKKLLIDAGASNPRICLCDNTFENPKVPPMLCMLLRKHLSGAKILSLDTLGFERAAEIVFEARDEMGFLSKKYIYAEIMGKYSNIIFCDESKRVITATKISDLSGSVLRPILSGVTYTPPILQEGKISPLDETEEGFCQKLSNISDKPISKMIMSCYSGISPLVAREIEFTALKDGGEDSFVKAFFSLVKLIKEKKFTPIIIKNKDGVPVEYSFMPIRQYGDEYDVTCCENFSELLNTYFSKRILSERIHTKASDLQKLMASAEARITRKISAQKADLDACKDKEKDKRYGDLITANIYKLSRGMSSAIVTDYYDESCPEIEIALDTRLTPAQNAQKYYKRYNKSKSAEVNLTKQIALSEQELYYIEAVKDSLTRAETEADFAEIRRELYETGYASRIKTYAGEKRQAPKPMEFVTSSGRYKILCGKNNSQNDYLTHKLASKGDIWFHVKGMAGSHTVLFCNGEEPQAEDFTEAATIAAVYSKAPRGQKVAVDYTRIKNIKKPPASRPGYVTFSENYSAYVVPNEDLAERLRVK